MIDCHFGTDSKHFGINADNRHVELSKLLTHTRFQLLIAFIGHNLIAAALLLLSRSLLGYLLGYLLDTSRSGCILLMGCLYLLRCCACSVSKGIALNKGTSVNLHTMCHEDMLVLAMLAAPDGITTMEAFFLLCYRLGCGKLHVFKCHRLRICHGFLVTKHGLGKLLCAVCITHEETTVVLAPPAFEVFSKLLCSVHLLLAKLTFKRHKLHI